MRNDSLPLARRLTSAIGQGANGNGARNGAGPVLDASAIQESESVPRDNQLVSNARREFSSAFGDLARGKRNWQIIAFTLAGIVIVQSLTAYRLATAAHAIPYLVQVDRLGTLAVAGKAELLTDPDSRLVASQVADFVRSIRTVLPSGAAAAQADLLRRGYAFAAPGAAAFLNRYFTDPSHDPRVLGQRIARDVQLNSALRLPDTGPPTRTAATHLQTWRVQWTETDRALDAGDSTVVATWEGYITLEIIPPQTADAIESNPLGLRIASIAWTRIAARPLAATSDSLVSPTALPNRGDTP